VGGLLDLRRHPLKDGDPRKNECGGALAKNGRKREIRSQEPTGVIREEDDELGKNGSGEARQGKTFTRRRKRGAFKMP